MSRNVAIDVSELMKLAGDLGERTKETGRDIKRAVAEATDRVAQDATAAAPILTGELKAKIEKKVSGLSGRVWSDAKQGFFQEFGTSRHDPKPWITPALQREEPSFVKAVTDIVGKPL